MAIRPAVTWSFLIAILLPITAPAQTGHAFHNCDVWLRQCDADRARQFLFSTDGALRQVESDIATAQSSRDAAAAAERRLSDSLGDAYSEIDRLRIEIGRAETDLKRLNENARRAGAAAEQSHRDLEELQPKLEAARKALDAAVGRATETFEQGEPMQSVVAKLRDAEVALNRAEIACVDSLSQTDEYRKLQNEAQQREVARDALREQTPRDDDALATASKEWIDAKRRVKDLIETTKDADPAVVAARHDLNASRDEIASLRKQFERNLPNETQVADAQRALDEVQTPYNDAVKAAEAAEARAIAAQQSLDARSADADENRKALAAVENDVVQLDGQLDDVHRAIDVAEDQVNQALAQADRIRADREDAIIAVERAEAAERFAVCTFVFIPPPPLFYGGRHDHDHHGDWDRDHDHDRNHDHDRDRVGDRRADSPRRPRVDGEPVGRPRRAGGAEFVDGSKPTTQPATGGGVVNSTPAARAPAVNNRAAETRRPDAGLNFSSASATERKRLIAQRAAEREKAQQQRREATVGAQPARAVVASPAQAVDVVTKREEPVRKPQQKESERKPTIKMTAVGVREAAAERERQTAAKQATVVAERAQQREVSRAAEAAKDQSRRVDRAAQEAAARQRESQRDAARQQQREANQTADRQREAQRAAERQSDAAARDARRAEAAQQQQERRESQKASSDDGGKRGKR